MSNVKRYVATTAWLILVVCCAVPSMASTGDEVLARMEDVFSFGGDGEGILASIHVLNEYATGVSTEYRLAVAADTVVEAGAPADSDETTYALMYFLGGDNEGMVFLLHTPEADDEDSRMWLYMSSFEFTKELISNDDQSASFAGSTFTYADIAGAGEMRDDYSAEILREETVTVGSEDRAVWVLELTPAADAETDYGRVLLWVDREADLFLRLEGYDGNGTLTKEIAVTSLGTFEDRRIPEELIGRLDSGDVSTIRFTNMRRPDERFTSALFEAENLATFDPSAYGF